MSDGPFEVSELDLLAFVDGRLDPARRREVEAVLATRPDLAKRVREDMADNDAIRALLGPVLTEPVPHHLQRIVDRRRGSSRRPWTWQAVAATAMLAAAASGGWAVGKAGQGAAFTDLEALFDDTAGELAQRQAAPARPERRAEARSDANGGSIAWQSDDLAVELDQPDLSAQGFRLVDTRAVPGGEQSVMRMVYEDEGGRQVSLYLKARWEDDEIDEVTVTEASRTTRAYWYDGPFVFLLAGELPKQELARLARSIDDGVNTGPSAPLAMSRARSATGSH